MFTRGYTSTSSPRNLGTMWSPHVLSMSSQDRAPARSEAWVTSPFSYQTWLAGKCPTKMEVFMGKSTKNLEDSPLCHYVGLPRLLMFISGLWAVIWCNLPMSIRGCTCLNMFEYVHVQQFITYPQGKNWLLEPGHGLQPMIPTIEWSRASTWWIDEWQNPRPGPVDGWGMRSTFHLVVDGEHISWYMLK